MPDLAEPLLCRFDNFLLDEQVGTLCRLHPDGRQSVVQIGSRAFQILCLLADRRGEVVSQDDIMDAVWRNLAVEPNNLTVQLSALRRVLDANGGQGSCIQTIPGRGYRFIPEVTRGHPPSLRPAEARLAGNDLKNPGGDEAGAAPDAQPTPAASPTAAEPAPAATVPSVKPWRRSLTWIAATCLCTAALLAFAIRYIDHTPPSQAGLTAALAGMTPATVSLAERQPLSLVVLPFDKLGGDTLDDDTVDAITDDLTTDLSRRQNMLVIARNSAFTYKGKPIDIKRVGEELGVRYAVEGSVRKVDGTLRVNVQLASTETGAHIWADQFDIGRDGIGYDVDSIVRQIAFSLNIRVTDTEAARNLRERPSNPAVADILLRARSLYNRPHTSERQAELVPLYERAVELDPRSATALAGLAEALIDSVSLFAEDPTAPEKYRRADELLKRAELLRPDERGVMWTRVFLLGQQGRCEEVIPAAQRAAIAHPSLTGPRQWQGICLLRMGRAAEAITQLELAIRFNPRNPNISTRYRIMGFPMLFLGRYDEAIHWFQMALAAHPRDSSRTRSTLYAAIAAAHALAGHTEQARANAVEASRLNPMLTARSYFLFTITNPVAVGQVSRMRDGLRLAGIRDHVEEDADFGLLTDDTLHSDYEAPTPTTVPGARTIRTADLIDLLAQRKPLVLDPVRWGQSIPGAIGLWGVGIGGSLSDEFQDRLARKINKLTSGDMNVPIVTMGFNAERFQGRNLALRLVALGYTNVYWYRGGREAWEVAGLPQTELVMQDW